MIYRALSIIFRAAVPKYPLLYNVRGGRICVGCCTGVCLWLSWYHWPNIPGLEKPTCKCDGSMKDRHSHKNSMSWLSMLFCMLPTMSQLMFVKVTLSDVVFQIVTHWQQKCGRYMYVRYCLWEGLIPPQWDWVSVLDPLQAHHNLIHGYEFLCLGDQCVRLCTP